MVKKMCRNPIILLFLVGIILLALVGQTDAKRAKRGKGKKRKKPKKPSVTITRYDLCHACVATIEEYQKEVEAQVVINKRELRSTGQWAGDLKVDGNAIANSLCTGPRFSAYSDNMKYGCQKLMQDHYMTLVGGLQGDQQVGSRRALLPHKKSACAAADACVGHMAAWLTETQLADRTPCAACKLIVQDIDMLLFREAAQVPSKKRLGELIAPLCADLGLRHENPAFLEEHCDELIDDLQGDAMRAEDSVLVGNIKLRKRLESAGLKPSNSLAEKVCGELQGYCGAAGPADAAPATGSPESLGDKNNHNQQKSEL